MNISDLRKGEGNKVIKIKKKTGKERKITKKKL